MTGNTMNDMLGRRLEDEDLAKFPLENRMDAVNNAMLRMANILDNDHLEELRAIDLAEPCASGKVTAGLAGLDNGLVRNGVQKVYDQTNGNWLHLVDPMDLEKQANGYLAPGDNYGIAYVYGANLYVEGGAVTIISVDIWYIGEPTLYTATTFQNDTVCPLNIGLHALVVDFAEAELWKQDGKGDKAEGLLKTAYQEVSTLNERAVQERKEQLGRKTS